MTKCKDCECHWDIPVKDYSTRNEHYCHWWCMANFKGIGGSIDKLLTGYQGTDGKYIKSMEYQSSPKWCPKRTCNEY